jgi:hypothetical protein
MALKASTSLFQETRNATIPRATNVTDNIFPFKSVGLVIKLSNSVVMRYNLCCAEILSLNYFSLLTYPNDFSILVEFHKEVFCKSQFSIRSDENEIILTNLDPGPNSNFKFS